MFAENCPSNRQVKCPICLDLISGAFEIVKCGHSFCHACIMRHIRLNNYCPCCQVSASDADLRPNHDLERQVKKLKRTFDLDEQDLSEFDIDAVYGSGDGEASGIDDKYQLFLHNLLSEKQRQLDSLMSSIERIKSELDTISTTVVPDKQMDFPKELFDLYDGHYATFKTLFPRLNATYSMQATSSVVFGDILASASNVVSSIEYNKRNNLFAASGSCKQIRIYNVKTFACPFPVFGSARPHLPQAQINLSTKVASLNWRESDNQLAAADYEGSIKLFDVNRSDTPITGCLDEHERRVWSVDYSPSANTMLSGSDDGKVKNWCLRERSSSFTVDFKANVCSVEYHPNGQMFAVGSADHSCYVRDIRMPLKDLYSMKDHKKAVSYVRWLDKETLLSASTDNTIKQWNIMFDEPQLSRTHTGHLHEKNFVGLAVNPDPDSGLFACGSESNKVCLYSRYFENPLCELNLGGRDPLSGEFLEMEGFASSVCWVGDDRLLAGNSLGLVSIAKVHMKPPL